MFPFSSFVMVTSRKLVVFWLMFDVNLRDLWTLFKAFFGYNAHDEKSRHY